MIDTVDQFIEALGGTGKAADAFGVTSPAISNWKRTDRFPAWVHGRVLSLAQENGLTVNDALLETTKPGPKRADEIEAAQ